MSRLLFPVVTFLVVLPVLAQNPGKLKTLPPAHSRSCEVVKDPPTDAERMNAAGEPKKADELYKTELAAHPADAALRAASIRNLIDEDLIDQADQAAQDFVTETKESPISVEITAEVRFRRGDLPESYVLLLRSNKEDPCYARTYLAMAAFEDLSGFHATAEKHVKLARQLDPQDLDIHYRWIGTLPRDKQVAAMQEFFDANKGLSEKRRRAFAKSLQKVAAIGVHPCRLVSTAKTYTVPMQEIAEDRHANIGTASYGLKTFINGKDRNLQIDTGATGILVAYSMASGLDLTYEADSFLGGVGSDGRQGSKEAFAKKISIGGMDFEDCSVTVLANSGLMGGSSEIGQRLDNSDGLIGTDVFRKYLVTLNYLTHELRVDPLPANPTAPPPGPAGLDALGGFNDASIRFGDRTTDPSMAKWTRVYRDGHMLFMPTHLNSSPGTKLFLVDTGAA
ncbi:MAG: retropepsin-like aspartic protease, partial [Bryocella sp.]